MRRFGYPMAMVALGVVLATSGAAATARHNPTVTIAFESTPATSDDPGFSNDNIVIHRDGHGDYGHGNRTVTVSRAKVFGASVAVATGGRPVECTLRVNGRQVSRATAEGVNAVATCYWYA